MDSNDPNPTRWWQRKPDQPSDEAALERPPGTPEGRTPADLQAAIDRTAELRRRAEQAAA